MTARNNKRARTSNRPARQDDLRDIGSQTLAATRRLLANCQKDVARHARHEWLHLVGIYRTLLRTGSEVARVGRDGLVRSGATVRRRLDAWVAAGAARLAVSRP